MAMTTPRKAKAALLLILLVGMGGCFVDCDERTSDTIVWCARSCQGASGRMAKYNATEGCVCEYGNK